MKIGFMLSILWRSISCFASYSSVGMSLEEKVGQLLMVTFRGEEANEDAKMLIQRAKVGGFIYYNWSNGLGSFEKVRVLSAGLQDLARENGCGIPLFIAVDQEGGGVCRLKEGFTRFPGNKEVGDTGDYRLAKEIARTMGAEMKAVGVNINLAPVVDINSNPNNPVIGARSFSDSAKEVVAFAKQALDGYREAGIIATLKHFPGHGDTFIDSHMNLPVLHKSIKELEQMELIPFRKLADSVDVIMTAHILVPAFDSENCATLSKKTIDYLRQVIGFSGIVVSDSLMMNGVLKQCQTVDEAAIRALDAGCDILIFGGRLLNGEHGSLSVSDIERIHLSIVEAVRKGHVAEARVDEAVERILDLKNRYFR